MKLKLIITTLLLSTYINANCKYYYQIGNIDPKYNLSYYDIKDILYDIEYEWESKVGLDFLEYSNTNNQATKINLIYNNEIKKYEDYGYQVDYLKSLLHNIENDTYDLEVFNNKIKSDESTLSYDINVFNTNASLNKYSKSKFNTYRKKLEERQVLLNSNIEQYSKAIIVHNNNINEYNQMRIALKDFKTINKLVGHETRGITVLKKENSYTKDIFGKLINSSETIRATKIDIFRMNSINELKVVIAHEMGHMFGLDHIDKLESLMNSKISKEQKQKFQITKEDVELARNHLKKVCFN